MGFFSSMRLSTRIYIQQAVLVLALIGMSLYSLNGASRVSAEALLIRDVNMPMSKAMTEAVSQRLRQNQNFERMMRYGPDIQRSESRRELFEGVVRRYRDHDDRVHAALADVQEYLEKFIIEERSHGDLENVALLEAARGTTTELSSQQKEFRQRVEAIIADFEAGRFERALIEGEKLEAGVSAGNEKIESFVVELQTIQADPINNINNTAETLESSLFIIACVAVIVALIMVVYTGFTLRELRKAMGNIGNSVQQVASAASQSSNAISVVADGSKQQSEAISQAVTAVSQSAAVLADVSRSAEGASDLSKQTATTIHDGRAQMSKMAEVVNRIADNSGKINKITDVINNLASQTNMLSLNAAIEAARAGEHGKGFAVVAEQVRKLAESSRSSVQDIVDLAQQAARDASEAVLAADRVNVEMGKIAGAASETEHMMQSIATAMEEQVATVEEMQHNMDTLKSIGNNNANAAEEITQTILELSHIADDTNNEVRKFNI
ncbi:MAG: methyl-accepting chemotaxis protein [Moraxellaceae bacterium]|nr:methyl-accepting chemotaxis protein [Moraxellaceae bacterium]